MDIHPLLNSSLTNMRTLKLNRSDKVDSTLNVQPIKFQSRNDNIVIEESTPYNIKSFDIDFKPKDEKYLKITPIHNRMYRFQTTNGGVAKYSRISFLDSRNSVDCLRNYFNKSSENSVVSSAKKNSN